MDYKTVIGQRIRSARLERKLTLADLSRQTGDVLSLKRINAYENGDRMPGPSEAAVLGKALGEKPSYLMGLDDSQVQMNKLEESLVRNWRALSEKDRMEFFRKLETAALQNRDPVSDARTHRATGKAPGSAPTPKRVRR